MTSHASPASPSRVRLDFLDVVRFAAMVFMVQGHTLDALVRADQLDVTAFPWNLWHALRGLTAPMFLLLSGAVGCLVLGRGADGRVPARRLLHRAGWGLKLLALGYLLVFPANRLADLRWLSPDVWRGFLQVGILQLNGLLLLVLTGLAALTRSDRAYAAWALGLGAALVLATPFVARVDCFACLPEAFAAFLSPAHGSLFPLFPHGAYLLLGVGIGQALKGRSRDEALDRFLDICDFGGAAALVLSALLARGLPPIHDATGLGLAFTFSRLGFALLLMGLVARLARRAPAFAGAVAPLGRRSLAVYVGHLLLLYGLPWIHGVAQARYRSMSLAEGFAAVALVGGLTFGGVAVMDLIQRRAAPLNALLRLSTAALLAWALVF